MDDRLCKACGSVGTTLQRFCRGCGCELGDDELSVEQTLVLDFPEQGVVEQATSGCSRVFYILLGLFILLPVITDLSGTRGGRHGTREGYRQKACYANMRVIQGAVEMYNMDHGTEQKQMCDHLVDADVTSPDGLLVRGGYLKRPITRYEPDCYYSGQGLSKDGKIVCSRHGTVE